MSMSNGEIAASTSQQELPAPEGKNRRRTELMQKKIEEEFKVKDQQVHTDITQTREAMFHEIASIRTVPASKAYDVIQDRVKHAALDFEEAQKQKRMQQFEEVAGIRRHRAASLPNQVEQSQDTSTIPSHVDVSQEIKSANRLSVREIASTFQGSSIPDTMEAFLQKYVHTQQRRGSYADPISAWQQKNNASGAAGLDVSAAMKEFESLTESQKQQLTARFVAIRKTHGLDTSSQEIAMFNNSLKATVEPTQSLDTQTSTEALETRTEANNSSTPDDGAVSATPPAIVNSTEAKEPASTHLYAHAQHAERSLSLVSADTGRAVCGDTRAHSTSYSSDADAEPAAMRSASVSIDTAGATHTHTEEDGSVSRSVSVEETATLHERFSHTAACSTLSATSQGQAEDTNDASSVGCEASVHDLHVSVDAAVPQEISATATTAAAMDRPSPNTYRHHGNIKAEAYGDEEQVNRIRCCLLL